MLVFVCDPLTGGGAVLVWAKLPNVERLAHMLTWKKHETFMRLLRN